jgi:tRNA nucleotidyltransferase (CCA-adding enzyme)
MRTYLVGGAVRDRLLGRDGGDRDYVVVGATVEQMLVAGFKPVGKDFPVFLHPQTKQEHALARTERKSGPGYTGFVVHAEPSVTLEDDLARRDLTINAIAEDEQGNLVDPFGGARDLEARVLRHVSPAFAEDPVRLLRVARFAARYAPLGFSVAPETMQLMRDMVAAGEVDALVPERVWAETRKALAEPKPSAFLRVLRETGALAKLFPEVDALYGVPQRAEYHPEVDTGIHIEMVCDMAAALAPGDARIGFAALVHDLGKALTPADVLPKHINHEHAGLPAVRAVCDRCKVPTDYRKLAEATCREHLNVHRVPELKAKTVHDLIARCDGFRQPQRIADMALVCEADKRGRAGLQDVPYPSRPLLLALHAAACQVTFAELGLEEGVEGPEIAEALRKARIRAIQQARTAWDAEHAS